MDRINALYVRVSTDEQAKEGYSISTQIEKLTAYAKFQGWVNYEIFADEGESAKDMNRPAMKRLTKLIKQGKIATVATIAVDRLSRNLLDMLQFIDLCESHQTAYICLALNFDTSTPIGRMVLQILAAFAEFERSMISTRVKSNMIEIADKQKRYLAEPPYGYKLDDQKRLEIVPEEAQWIVKAAEMFVSGYGYRAVTKFLNDSGVPTRKGKPWLDSTVRQILTNELYIGTVIWNRRYTTKDGKQRWRDSSEWIVNENAHEPILTKEIWDEIQKRIVRKMPKGGERQMKYRLSGMLTCGYCGARMVSRPYGNKGPNAGRFIFVCSNYQKKASCQFNYIFMDEAEESFPSFLKNAMEGGIDIQDKDFENARQSREEEFARRDAAIDQKFQRQIQAFENGIISERDLRLARERIDKERELLQLEKERIKTPQKSEIQNLIKEEAKRLLWLWDNGALPLIQSALKASIKSIIVINKKIIDIDIAQKFISPEDLKDYH